jgi:hypothetical protein
MYSESSFAHIAAAVVSFATSLNTRSPRHKMIALKAFSFNSVFSAAERLAYICASPFNASTHLF